MPLVFPRDLPAGIGFTACRFEPVFRQTRSTTGGGQPQVAEVAPSLWSMKYTTRPLEEAEAEVMRAWLQSLRGGQKLFKAYDPIRQWPLVYPTGFTALTRAAGSAFDGTATLAAISATLDTITLSTLPSAFRVSVGDMVSISYASGRRTLHRAMEATTASGGVAAFQVEPILFPGSPVGTAGAVRLAAPWCPAVIDPNSDIKWNLGRWAQISFSAMQVY